jgi:hypothetical protein
MREVRHKCARKNWDNRPKEKCVLFPPLPTMFFVWKVEGRQEGASISSVLISMLRSGLLSAVNFLPDYQVKPDE